MDLDEVLRAKSYLRRLGEWPLIDDLDAQGWLGNFSGDQMDYAVALLDSFIFISARQVRELFVSTVHALSEEITRDHESYSQKKEHWNSFLDTAIFTAPTGETPNPSDSGHIFLRHARTELGIDEERIVESRQLNDSFGKQGSTRPSVVFVDDFTGSGSQFITTWERGCWRDGPQSIKELVEEYDLTVWYLPLIATEYALDGIRTAAPRVKIRPTYTLTKSYSALDANTVVIPEHLRAGIKDFVDNANASAGVPRLYRYGYRDLALNLAFEHSIPDACLGILWNESREWKPLKPKK